MKVGLDTALGDKDIVLRLLRIQGTKPLPVLDGVGDIHSTTQERAVLEGVRVARLVLVEEFKKILPLASLEFHPSSHGLVDEMPVRMCGLEFVDERGLASANVTLDGNQSIRVGHFEYVVYFFRGLLDAQFYLALSAH